MKKARQTGGIESTAHLLKKGRAAVERKHKNILGAKQGEEEREACGRRRECRRAQVA